MTPLQEVFKQSFEHLTLAFPLSPRLGRRRTPHTCLQAHQVPLYELTEPQTLFSPGCTSSITLYALWLYAPLYIHHGVLA